MRVGVIGLQHESNTFIPQPTTLEDFRRGMLLTGEAVRKAMAGSHHEIGGFFEGLDKAGLEAVPLFHAAATPSGAVTDEATEAMVSMILRELDGAGKLDGLLVAPHGAGVGQSHPDLDGYWLERVRQKVGPKLPIVCTLDAHANLTPRMIQNVQATIVYRSNPHLDQRQRGLEAAALLARILRGEVRPTQAAAYPAMAINIERQHTPSHPCKPMYDLADAQLTRKGVLSNSIVLGFPYADVPEMGSAFIAVTDNDPALAQRLAQELADYAWEHRKEFEGQYVDVEPAIEEAAKAGGPVCLLDMGDNVGGGSPGDGTRIARAIQARGGPKAFVALWDAEAAAQARAAGVGAKLTLKMGGKSLPVYGPPLEASVEVVSLHDGKFEETQVRHGGMRHFDMGPTAIVRTDAGLTVQLMTRRVFPTSLVQLTSCGLDPKSFGVLIAKGVQAPVAAYAPVCVKLIRVNTQGTTDADMRRLTFKNRRRPLFPFEAI